MNETENLNQEKNKIIEERFINEKDIINNGKIEINKNLSFIDHGKIFNFYNI